MLKNQAGEGILGYAIHVWRPKIIRCLLRNGAQPNSENWAHITRIAGIAGDELLVRELKSIRQK